MPALALCWCVGVQGAPRIVVVEESPEDPEPGKVETSSETYRLRLSGLMDSTLGRDASGNMVGIPRARLRAEGLVSTTLEVGFVAEVDLSPWASPDLKEDGPGLVRDLYARMSMGNKKLLDLGEARLGLFTLPVLGEQMLPLADTLFLTGSAGREAWLPGRELAAAYEAGAYRYNIPVKGMVGLGSGVVQGFSFANAGTALDGVQRSAAERVPLTAGAGGVAVVNPSLSLRLEAEPFLRMTRALKLTLGGGLLVRPLSTGPDARGAAALDLAVVWNLLSARVSGMLVDSQRPPFLDSRALMVEAAFQFIPDFADVRVRYDTAFGPDGWEAHRIHLGAAFFYLDGVPAQALTSSPVAFGRPLVGRAFTLMWQRSYDLMRFAPGRAAPPPGALADQPTRLGYGFDTARWLSAGDTDQLVVRIAF